MHVPSVPITTKVGSSNPAHGEVYSLQYCVIKVINDLRQSGGFLRVVESDVKHHKHNPDPLASHHCSDIIVKNPQFIFCSCTLYYFSLKRVNSILVRAGLEPKSKILNFRDGRTSHR